MKDQVSRLSLLGVSAISIGGDINSTAEIKKVESGDFLSFTDHQNLGLATLDGEECWKGKRFTVVSMQSRFDYK